MHALFDRTRRGILLTLCTLAIAFAASSPALAQPTDGPGDTTAEAERLAEQAQTAFAEERFSEAVKFYLKAYNLAPAAILLYNVAYIYDKKLSEYELASEYYRRYVRADDADPQVVEKALARIQELKDLEAKPPVDPVPDPPDKDPKSNGNSTGVTGQTPGDGGQAVAGWATLIAGAALVAGGVTFGILANNTHSDFDNATTAAEKQDLADTGETQALVSDVLNGVGAAAMIAGVVLIVTADSGGSAMGQASADETDWRFGAGATPDGSGAMVVVGGRL